MKSQRLSKRRLYLIVGVSLFVIAGWVYCVTPCKGSLDRFDPQATASSEARMWNYYYDKKFLALGWCLFATVRKQFRLSPWNAAKIAWPLARGTKVFQSSHSRGEAEKAIPFLEQAYARLALATGSSFDTHRAARLELEWWQQRREHVPPDVYADTIVSLACEVYSCPKSEEVSQAIRERVRMMEFRDAHRKVGMSTADWDIVEKGLQRSYSLFHDVVTAQGSVSDK